MSQDLADGVTERQLLQSIVEVARYVYGAAASSVFMVDPGTGELIFAAVTGSGGEQLIGTRFPAGTGIASWVVASCQPVIADDLDGSDQFARDAASSTGFVPSTIMAAPLIADGECIGVLEVLDRYSLTPPAPGRELHDMELLGLVAVQAALGLALLRRHERAGRPAERLESLVARWAGRPVSSAVDPLALTLLAASVDLLDRP
ncbi:GAF domain-containing protein [Actinoplanes sp. NPDC049668]|uniref:GAF domain-containing protein n=1 Tax=unclassified Actinoplanes TaxID=2626549 RepID=UPI0033BB4CD3